jgi:formylglycine-generating enzyme
MPEMSKRNGDVVRRLVAAMLVAVSASRPVPAAVTFDWATVGNPGNAADTLVMNKGPAPDSTTGYGSVGYTYQISKYDVTNSQYVQFLNAVDPTGANGQKLYDSRMTSWPAGGVMQTGGINFTAGAAAGSKFSVKTGQDTYPATWINWTSGARFVNWLANGQGSGSTESGVYDMSVFTGNSYATPPARAVGATIFLPSEDEYYKAAYYDQTKNGGTGGYWQYGTRSDTAPASVAPAGTSNSANIGAGVGNGGNQGGVFGATAATTQAAYDTSVNYLTNVGAYTAATSFYGLYDVDGLVYNWTEATRPSFGNNLPIYRGGAWYYNAAGVGAAYRNIYSGAAAPSYSYFGFRIAGLPAAPPGTTVNVASGTQTQAQAGYALFSGTAPLTKTGAGTLVVNAANTLTGSTTVQQGTLQLANAAALASSVVTPLAGGTVTLAPYLQTTVGGLAPNAGGLVDVGNGLVTVTSGLTVSNMLTAITAGYNGGTWTGTTGITSSNAATSTAGGDPRAIGWLDNGDGSVTFAFAAPGDTNLDGLIDVLDAAALSSAGRFNDTAVWSEGDFNYDGIYDDLDNALFVSTGLFDAGPYNAPPGAAGAIAPVPEPATWAWGLAGLAAAGFIRRRR